ncbi:glutamate synthase-related protein [Vibrio chagasii]|nr:glutamate synthase-related protein [Vibrio chagasii]
MTQRRCRLVPLSPEAHEALAMAMNRLGGYSQTQAKAVKIHDRRFGTDRNLHVSNKLVSGRFGGHRHYLTNADAWQIKVAKVRSQAKVVSQVIRSQQIAKLRYSVQGCFP